MGEVAHIRAVEPDNLILLCASHHKLIDSGEYTQDALLVMKRSHESKALEALSPADALVRALQQTLSGNTVSHGSILAPQGMIGGQVAHTIINLGPQDLVDSVPRHDQIIFRFHNFHARFMRQDGYGGPCPAKLADARWAEYRFKVDIYSFRLAATGLMDI